MRYKDLITVLFIVATATWLWAEPSQEVRLPSQQPSLVATEPGWTVPDLDLPSATQRVLDSTKPQQQPVRPTRIRPAPKLVLEAKNPARLDVSIHPGADFDSTWFEVTYRGPKDYSVDNVFTVDLGGQSGSWYTSSAAEAGHNTWRFQGADLQAYEPEQRKRPEFADSLRISVMVRDNGQSRFSRGSNRMVLESEPVQLTFR
jgi:hypothetical protein